MPTTDIINKQMKEENLKIKTKTKQIKKKKIFFNHILYKSAIAADVV